MGMDAPPCLLGYHDHSFMPGSRVCMRCWWAPRELIQPNPVGRFSQPVRRLSALEKVLRHWGNICVFCGAEATTRDHLVPQSRGGRDALINLRPACSGCNRSKGKMTPPEWLGDKCPEEFKNLVEPFPGRYLRVSARKERAKELPA